MPPFPPLSRCIIDPYVRRNKSSRDYPRKKQETPPSAPTILIATRTQINRAAEIAREQKGLTA